MRLIETEETNKFTFEPFAAHPFYTAVNRSLVRQALAQFETRPIGEPLTIVDMACGTGAVTRLIAEEMARQGRPAHLIGVDPSAEALRRAERGNGGDRGKSRFHPGRDRRSPQVCTQCRCRLLLQCYSPRSRQAGGFPAGVLHSYPWRHLCLQQLVLRERIRRGYRTLLPPLDAPGHRLAT